MTRFFLGLLGGVVAAFATWFLSHGNDGMTLFVGILVTLIIWVPDATEAVADWAKDMWRWIDDLLP